MYLDKPLKAHTLMQAIARANRGHEGKNNGLVVDYCGILKNLRKALATFAGYQGTGVINGEKPQPEVDPVKPEEELLSDLAKAIDMIVAFLDLRNFRLNDIKEFERTPAKNTMAQNLKYAIEQRLHRMIQQNPLRTDFQKHFEQIVEEYNREKDKVTIENTFEELLRFVDSLDEESMRAMQEGLDEESLAIFDLLVKPDLSSRDIKQIKEVAQKLLLKLKSEKLRIDNWREKQATRDDVKVEIANFLWNERTGLPKSYSEEEIGSKVDEVYLHVFQQYPNEQPAVYAEGF